MDTQPSTIQTPTSPNTDNCGHFGRCNKEGQHTAQCGCKEHEGKGSSQP